MISHDGKLNCRRVQEVKNLMSQAKECLRGPLTPTLALKQALAHIALLI